MALTLDAYKNILEQLKGYSQSNSDLQKIEQILDGDASNLIQVNKSFDKARDFIENGSKGSMADRASHIINNSEFLDAKSIHEKKLELRSKIRLEINRHKQGNAIEGRRTAAVSALLELASLPRLAPAGATAATPMSASPPRSTGKGKKISK